MESQLSLHFVRVVEEAATGVTEGSLLKGVRFFGEGVRVHSMVMTRSKRCVRFIDSIHLEKGLDVQVRLF